MFFLLKLTDFYKMFYSYYYVLSVNVEQLLFFFKGRKTSSSVPIYLGCYIFLYSLPKDSLLKKLLKKEILYLSHRGKIKYYRGSEFSSDSTRIKDCHMNETV